MWKACNARELLSHNFHVVLQHYVLQKDEDTRITAEDHCKYPYVAPTLALKNDLNALLAK